MELGVFLDKVEPGKVKTRSQSQDKVDQAELVPCLDTLQVHGVC